MTAVDVIANLLFANRIIRNGQGQWKGMDADRAMDQVLAEQLIKAMRQEPAE